LCVSAHVARALTFKSLFTVLDAHSRMLSWLGGAGRPRDEALGVDSFGQTGTITDVYRVHGIDAGGDQGGGNSKMTGGS
jgi:pyruvate dehydrogenase E1 component